MLLRAVFKELFYDFGRPKPLDPKPLASVGGGFREKWAFKANVGLGGAAALECDSLLWGTALGVKRGTP